MKLIYSTFATAALLACTVACSKPTVIEVAHSGCLRVTAVKKSDGAEEIREILERCRVKVDSIKSPVIGEAAHPLEKQIPESPLMNFAADALLEMARKETGENIDIAITNKGGLRSNINQGTLTFGDIYNVFPFENTLALLTLNGEQLLQLCDEIAAVGGEAVAGMRMSITPDWKAAAVTVTGKPVEKGKEYRIATSDYLSQGNDKMTTLALGKDKRIFSNITIRALMVQYIKELAAEGKKLQAECDGRITKIK